MNETSTQNQSAIRREKLNAIRDIKNAYPNHFQPENTALELQEAFDAKSKEELEAIPQTFSLAGRIMQDRHMGKAAFFHLQDRTGRMQLYLRKQDMDEQEFTESKSWDLGDIIYAQGNIFKTNKGELTLYVKHASLLTKALHPLPDKYHGLTDTEACYRRRYLDLMVNKTTKERFVMRSKITQAVRDFLIEHDFLEVETPMMHKLAGGAAAKPFATHHNALDIPLFMRIAPELHLKRLVVGGMDRVFEINRNFRNEGISTRHNPEFTMLEFYRAYATFSDLMAFTENMLSFVTQRCLGTTTVNYQGHTLDFAGPYQKMSMTQATAHFGQIEENRLLSHEGLLAVAQERGIAVDPSWDSGKLQLELFEQLAEKQLIQPTFITAYPRSVSPLARASDDNPELTDRFEFFVAGNEIANGFSELNDPDDQRERFQAQVAAKAEGDDEAMPYDADYIKALEYGLPPTAGEGIGIDRLCMLLTDAPSIRDVILFPLMKSANEEE